MGTPAARQGTPGEAAEGRGYHPLMPSVGRRAQRRPTAATALVVIAYFALGLVAHWPVLPGETTRIYFPCNCGDVAQTVWFLAWVPHALLGGHNPLYTDAMNYPVGVNLAQNTATPLLGLLATPLTETLGPVASANFWMVLAMPLSAASAFVVLRHWRVGLPAAALGGLFYGFSPYVVGQGIAHLDLTFVPLPPLIILVVVDTARSPRHPLRLGALLGALVVAQFLVSAEILATVTILCGVGMAATAIRTLVRDPATLARRIRPMAKALAFAAVVAAACLAEPVIFELAGPHHFVGPVQGANNPYRADLLDFVVPSPAQWLAPGGLRTWGMRLTHLTGMEDGAYLGIPVLVLAVWLGWRSRASPRSQLALVIGALAAVLSLGPHLRVDGRSTGVPLPFLVLQHLPVVASILPIRMSFETDAAVAAVIAFGVDDCWRRAGSWAQRRARERRSWHAGGSWTLTVATLAIVAVTLAPAWLDASAPTSTPAVLSHISLAPRDPVALTYPFVMYLDDQPLAWQAATGFRFNLVGGYALVPGQNGAVDALPAPLAPSDVEAFLGAEEIGRPYLLPVVPTIDAHLVADTAAFVRRYDVGLVAVDRRTQHSDAVVRLFTLALGRPPRRAGRLDIWRTGAWRVRDRRGATLSDRRRNGQR